MRTILVFKMGRHLLLLSPFLTLAFLCSVNAQPSPGVQERISAAIEAAGNATDIDYTAFVNPFIGTGALSLSFLVSLELQH